MAKSINISKFIKFVDVRKYDYYIVYKLINNSEAFFSFEEIPCQFVDNFIETIGIIYENKLIPAGLIRKKREEDITLLGLDINDAYYVNKNYLSANNIFMYRKRKNKYQQRFVEKINYIKNTLGEKDIDINTVVITNGSALEA